jgi:hypothetical protein
MTRRETEAVRRADEFFRNLPDELPDLPYNPDDPSEPKEKRRS